MRRYYLGCILSLMTVLVSSQVNYHFTIDPQSVSITQNNGYSIINMDGMDNYMNEIGKPQIPYITKRFVIPKNARVTEVKISNIVQQKLDGNFLIYPSQAPILVNRMEDDIADGFVSPDPTVYTSNQSYPEDCYKKVSDEIYFGHRIVTLQLYPVSYTPFDKELYVNSFDVTIEYDLEASIDDVQGLQSKLRMTEERNFIASIVANGNDLQRFYTPLARSAQSLATGDRTISVKNEPLKPDYIIITRDSLQASFKDLVEWKRKKGVYAILKTVEEISKSFQGSDLTEQIRNYLKEQHMQWGSSLYVLLGGECGSGADSVLCGNKGYDGILRSVLCKCSRELQLE